MAKALYAEAHAALGLESCMALMDLQAFFDSMDLAKLFSASINRAYALRILLLAFSSFLSPRVLKADGWIAAPVFPGRSITAGETSGVEMARTLLYDTLAWLHQRYPLVNAQQWIDDLVLYLAGTTLHITRVLPSAVAGLSRRFNSLGLYFASKSRIVASSRELAALVRNLLGRRGVIVQDAPVSSDLGLDQRGGRAGPQPKAATRRKAAARRTASIFRLNATRPVARLLVRTGPCAAEAYALKATGASYAQIAEMRRVQAKTIVQVRPLMCLTSMYAAATKHVKEDPLLGAPWAFLEEWLRLWYSDGYMRVLVRSAWPRVLERVRAQDPKVRWRLSTGSLSGVIITLLERGWDPRSPDLWLAPDVAATEWRFGEFDAAGPVIDLEPFLLAFS